MELPCIPRYTHSLSIYMHSLSIFPFKLSTIVNLLCDCLLLLTYELWLMSIILWFLNSDNCHILLLSWDKLLFFNFKCSIDECKIVTNLCTIWSTCCVANGYGNPSGMSMGKITYPWVRLWYRFIPTNYTDINVVFLYPTYTMPIAIIKCASSRAMMTVVNQKGVWVAYFANWHYLRLCE
jgi:hypothetical protein